MDDQNGTEARRSSTGADIGRSWRIGYGGWLAGRWNGDLAEYAGRDSGSNGSCKMMLEFYAWRIRDNDDQPPIEGTGNIPVVD